MWLVVLIFLRVHTCLAIFLAHLIHSQRLASWFGDLAQPPVDGATSDVCEALGVDPHRLIGSGAFVAVVDAEDAGVALEVCSSGGR